MDQIKEQEQVKKAKTPLTGGNIILFDDEKRDALLPLVFTRPVAEIRIGILTISEKWEKRCQTKVSYITQEYLNKKYPINVSEDNWVINGGVCPSEMLMRLVSELEINEALLQDDDLIAARLNADQFNRLMNDEELESVKGYDLGSTPFIRVQNTYDIFKYNEKAIEEDFLLLTRFRDSQKLSNSNQVIGDPDNIFIEKGATVECSILNAKNGPIYIGKNATIMEGSMVRGPLALCDNGTIKMGAKIYPGTTIGPHCKVGGEVSNSVFFAYSNKGHDGYLGNSVIAEWCNLGADTNNSNLKNNYDQVKLWSYVAKKFRPTGLQFCGLIMGDHSKTSINSMFNTGTVVGVACNIFGTGFPRNFIPSFSWGGASGFISHQLDKALTTAKIMMARRDIELSEDDIKILETIQKTTEEFRPWDKKNKS